MQPARLDLRVTPGATNRKTIFLQQPSFAYAAVERFEQSSPLRVSIPAHGLPGDWPVWFEGVSGLSLLNTDKLRQQPRIAKRIDADTIELNDIAGATAKASGGSAVYRLPVDLTDCTGMLLITGTAGTLQLTTENEGLVIAGPGRISIVLTPAQSQQLLDFGAATYTLDLAMSNGDITRWANGAVLVGNAGGCHAC